MNNTHLYIWSATLCLVLIASVAGCVASMSAPLCVPGMDYNKPGTSADDYEFTIGWC
jgi:hypothetical protein